MKTYFKKMKLSPTSEEKPMTAQELLLQDIRKTQHALEVAYAGFDNATDPDLIDCYIYEVNSALKRYRFLINQAQRMQLFTSEPAVPDLQLVVAPMPGNLS